MACGTIPELEIAASCDTLQTGYDGDLAWIFNPDDFTVTAAAGVATITTTSGVLTQIGGADNSVTLVSAPARTDMGMARYTHTANVAVLNYSAAVKDALYGIGSKRVGLIVKRNDGIYVLAGYGAISTNVVSAPLCKHNRRRKRQRWWAWAGVGEQRRI